MSVVTGKYGYLVDSETGEPLPPNCTNYGERRPLVIHHYQASDVPGVLAQCTECGNTLRTQEAW